MELKGAVALVTGCTGGLGQYICRAFAKEGTHVAGVYIHSKEEAEALMAELSELGPRCVAIQADAFEESGIQAMVDATLREFGRIDILVNNAAYNKSVAWPDLDGLTLDLWNYILKTNTTAPWLASKAVAPIMKKQGDGRIVNVSSIAGLAPLGSSIAYAVSKAAMIHLTRCLAVALAPEIAVNSVAPGTMMGTRMTARLDPELVESTIQGSALRRPVERDDVADQIVTFCRGDSTTGQVLLVDSGKAFH